MNGCSGKKVNAHQCVCSAAEAASLATTTAIVAECASNNLTNWPHWHFKLCTLAHFLHLLASLNSSTSPVFAVFNGIQHPMSIKTEWALYRRAL